MKIQDLITNAPPSKEEDRFVEVRVRLFTHGNEAAVWKTVRSFMRNSILHAGNKIEFYAGGESLEDEDDHAILEQVEQEVPPQPQPPVNWAGLPRHEGPPFEPAWGSDPYSGHAPWCGVRVKVPCSCGYEGWLELKQRKAVPEPDPPASVGPKRTDPWMGSGLEIQYIQGETNT